MKNIKTKAFVTILLGMILWITSLNAQNTVGLLSYNQNKTFDGYNLIYPHNQSSVYLLNNCGEIVHEWPDEAHWRPGNTAYLTRDGLLYKSKRNAAVAGDPIWAGGGGAIFEIRDWDNNLLWDFEMNDSINRLHHDFALTPEGNIIAIAWELKTAEECLAAGRDTSTLAQGELWPDWILEIDPGLDSIVWEWHAWDHLVQDFDPAKDNFGVVGDHPELIDVNYGRPDGHPDWHHSNALDYNPVLDQIIMSVPYFDEFWIIDHTTTTQEASGHTGGFSNLGGDLMYRWGNPKTYRQGDSTDQKLFFQHDTHWIDDFVDPGHPHYGKIALFNNRAGSDYSTVNIVNPPWDMYEWRYLSPGNVFPPLTFDVIKTHPDTFPLYSTGLSSVQFLNNGNTLILSGRTGYAFELDPENNIVWEYKVPLLSGSPATQGDTLTTNNNLTFRLTRYPANYSAFEGKDLSPKGWIEMEPDTTYCALLTSSREVMDETAYRLYPNPVSEVITIEWDGMVYADIEIYNIMGVLVDQFKCSGGRKYLDVHHWENGVYFVSIRTEKKRYTRKFVIEH